MSPFVPLAVNSLSYKLLTAPTALIHTVDSRYLEYSITQTLLYVEQFIRSLGHLALDQSKRLSVSQSSISRIFAYAEQIF